MDEQGASEDGEVAGQSAVAGSPSAGEPAPEAALGGTIAPSTPPATPPATPAAPETPGPLEPSVEQEDEDETEIVPPAATGTLVAGMAPPAPRAGWRGNLACAALLPVAVVAGALAHLERSYHDSLEDLVVGAMVAGVFGFFLVPFARLAHRWGTEWLALLLASGPWILSSVGGDIGRTRLAWADGLASYHAAALQTPLRLGNFGGSSSALVLGALALVFALLLESRQPTSPAPLSRAPLLLALVPVSAVALSAAYAARMWGFVLIAIVLAVLAALRTARTVNLAEPRSLSLALASTIASTTAIAAAASGAVTHALALARDHLVGSHTPVLLVGAIERISETSIASAAPIVAVIPLVGLAFALEGRVRAPLARRAAVLSVAALGLVAWLDVRNLADVRAHLDGYLDATGARSLALPIPELELASLDGGSRVLGDFVVVPREGSRYFRGRPIPPGRIGLRGIPRGTPLLIEPSVRVVDALVLVGALGGMEPVPLVGLARDGRGLVSVDVGPFVAMPSGTADVIVLYLVLQENDTCVMQSSAGERIEMPGCWEDLETLRTRLAERRAAEPNRHDVVLAAERAITIGQLLPVVEVLDDTGYGVRPLVDISGL